MHCCNTAILGQQDDLHSHLKPAPRVPVEHVFHTVMLLYATLPRLASMGRVVRPRAQDQLNEMHKNSTLTTPARPGRPKQPCGVAPTTTTWMS